VTIEIAGLQVTLPLKFKEGDTLTENQAKVLDAAYQRQFTNNQTASAKSRKEALEKATTDAERAAKAPLTAEQIAALYTDYEPNVGGGPRQSSMEKTQLDGAWRAWVKVVGEHNDAIANGGEPVIARANGKPVAIPSAPRKAKDISEEAHKSAVEAFQAQRETFKAALLKTEWMAPRIEAEVAAILAERGAGKAETAPSAVVAGEDLL
jgi:hypothetical protein